MNTTEQLEAAETTAWEALLNDPRVIADPTAEHTPELKKAWEDACDALRKNSLARTLGIIE